MHSPRAQRVDKLKAEVAKKLNQLSTNHEDRISKLTSKLHASLQSPFSRDIPQALARATDHQHVGDSFRASNQPKLADVFDELLASDQARRMQQLNDEVTFRERELWRLKDALEQAQHDAHWSKQKHEAVEMQLTTVSNSARQLESDLRKMQQSQEHMAQQVQSLTAAKSAAERAATLADTRAATAETLLASKPQELQQLEQHYKRLLSDQQLEVDRLRQQVQTQAAEATKAQSAVGMREQQLVRELQAANSSLIDCKTALAAERSSTEQLKGKVDDLSAELQSSRRARQQLQAQVQQLESMLADLESERQTITAKYLSLGDKVEGVLMQEEQQKKAAAAEVAALQKQLQDTDQSARASQQQLQQQVQQAHDQLAEAQQALIEADRLHRKAAKKQDKQLLQLGQECDAGRQQYDVARQELLIKSAEMLDLQSQLEQVEGQHELQIAAVQNQVTVLQGQVEQLQQQLQQQAQAAAEREQQVRQEALAAAEDRLEIELRQQQLQYERQTQELELQIRYLSALDALSSPNPAAARRALDQAAAAAANGNLADGAPAGSDLPASFASSRFEAFDGRLQRTLAEHISKAEVVEAMEAKYMHIKKELSADYKRRLDSLEADWAALSQTRMTELEATHALKLQQVELSGRLERQRLEAHLAEVAASKDRLEEQLTTAQQELARVARESNALHVQLDELKLSRQVMQRQQEEANNSLRQMQGLVGQYSGDNKADHDVIADLMSRLELRTAERNDTMQAAAAAEAKLKVLEMEKLPRQQQQASQLQQALDVAEAGRGAAEAKLKQALTEAANAASAAEAAQAASARSLKRLQEEKAKMADSMEEASAAYSSLERELSGSQAETRSLASQLKDTRKTLFLLQEDHAALQGILARLKEERQQLMAVNQELEASVAQLTSQAAVAADEQRRLALLLEGLEINRAALQRKINIAEAEKQAVVRTNELRSTSPSFSVHSAQHQGPPGSPTAANAGHPLLAGCTSFTASASRPSSRPGSPALGGSAGSGGRESFAGFRMTAVQPHRATELMEGLAAPMAHHCSPQDLDGLLARFDEERRAMMSRYEALDSEAASLRQQLATAALRVSELSLTNEQLLASLERHKGVLMQESKAASELTDKVLSDVQRSSNDLAQLNAWLQSELESAHRGHKEALTAANAAEDRATHLEVKVSELQRAAASSSDEAQARNTVQLQQLQAEHASQMDGLRQQLAASQQDMQKQLAKQAKDLAERAADMESRHAKELQAQQATAVAAAEAAMAAASAKAATADAAKVEHDKQAQQLQQQIEQHMAAAAEQASVIHQHQQHAAELEEHLAAVTRLLLAVLQLPQELALQQQQQQQQQQSPTAGHYQASRLGPQQRQLGFSNAAYNPSSPQMLHSPTAIGQMSGLVGSHSPSNMWQSSGNMQQQQQGIAGSALTMQGPVGLSHDLAGPMLNQVSDMPIPVIPQDAVDMSAALCSSLPQHHSAEDAAGAVQVLATGLCQQLTACTQQVSGLKQQVAQLQQQLQDLQADNEQLLQDGAALAADFQTCATNLQSLVATFAFVIPLSEEAQQGLNAKDPAVFDEQLAALHEAIKDFAEAERSAAAAAMREGPLAALQQQLEEAQAKLAEATGTIKQMKQERQEEMARFKEGLSRARVEAVEGAEVARKESLAGLKAELNSLKAQLTSLQETHAAELVSLQAAAAQQLSSHVKTSESIIRELEDATAALQAQLAAQVERADAYGKELRRLMTDRESRSISIDPRKEQRQAGEIEALRERLRHMEDREREKEEELKQLKRSLRQKELSLLGSTATTTSSVDK